MGEVYRARDTKLNRDVALKVPQRRSRSIRSVSRGLSEKPVLASLNHPNIAAIYGLEETDSIRAGDGVVEGPTLADRIAPDRFRSTKRSPSLARSPTRSKRRTSTGSFIAISSPRTSSCATMDGKGSGFRSRESIDPKEPVSGTTTSPTITTPAATRMGVILGTAAYMAPEQARGKTVDKRADIWAFGCVLYEMLTGKRAFGGDDVTDTLAAVVRGEPSWDALPAATPVGLRNFLRRCLQKDPKLRLRDIGDARFLLDDAGSEAIVSTRSTTWSALADCRRGSWGCIGDSAVGALASRREPAAHPAQCRSRAGRHSGRSHDCDDFPRWDTNRVSCGGHRRCQTARHTTARSVIGNGLVRNRQCSRPIFLARQPFNGRLNQVPLWAPDGRHIVFESNSADSSAAASSIVWTRADGGGEPQTLFATKDGRAVPYSLTPDGLHLAYQQLLPDGASHVWTIPINLTDPDRPIPGKPELFLRTSFHERVPGRFPNREDVGRFPTAESWRNCPFGRATGARFSIRTWKTASWWRRSHPQAIHLPGTLPQSGPTEEAQSSTHVTFLLNFFDDLRRRVPAAKPWVGMLDADSYRFRLGGVRVRAERPLRPFLRSIAS